MLDGYARHIRDALARGDETAFEAAEGAADFYIRLGRTAKGREAEMIRRRAGEAVASHVARYEASRPKGPFAALKAAARWAGHAASDVAAVAGKIPVVGPALHATLAVTPFGLVKAIVSGERLDRALVDDFKSKIAAAREVAPYAQTVVSFVPGVGTGVAGAIGAGAALAEGRPISEAVEAGIRGALPGGPLVQSAFDVGMAAVKGQNVGKAALTAARNQLPDGPARHAFDVGLAVATGKNLQASLVNAVTNLAPKQLGALAKFGEQTVRSVPALLAVRSGLGAAPARGFDLASGLLAHSGVNERVLLVARRRLDPLMKQGFDRAVQAHAAHFPAREKGEALQNSIAKAATEAARRRGSAGMLAFAEAGRAARHVPRLPVVREAPIRPGMTPAAGWLYNNRRTIVGWC